MKTKLLAGLFLLGLFAAFAAPAVQAATPVQDNAGKIQAARVRGEVFVTDNVTKVKIPLQDNMVIHQGSVVSTGKESSVVLIFGNGATVSLGTESLLDIQQFIMDPFSSNLDMSKVTEEPTRSATKLNLTRGELVGKVAKLKKEQGSTFSVSTPVGAAGLRGTVFRIVYRPDGSGKAFFSMTTLEGNVEVSLVATGSVTAPVTVTDNKEVSVSVDVTTDPKTGISTVTLPTGQTFTVAPAPASSTQPIADVAQQIAQAVAAVVLPPPTPAPPTPPTTPQAKTTNGDGT